MRHLRICTVGLAVLAALAVVPPPAAVGEPTTAAERYGWTNLIRNDDFDGTALSQDWEVYDSAGHAGNGVRSPEQVKVAGGALQISGTPDGTTGGMAWLPGQLHGRWEARAPFPAGCGCYHPVLILWPDANDFPAGGEVDYAEVFDPARQTPNFFLAYARTRD